MAQLSPALACKSPHQPSAVADILPESAANSVENTELLHSLTATEAAVDAVIRRLEKKTIQPLDFQSDVPLNTTIIELPELAGYYETVPIRTHHFAAAETLDYISNGGTPRIFRDKNAAPYWTGALKIAPWISGTKKHMDKAREEDPTVPYEGVQRSASHCRGGQVIKLDCDGITPEELAHLKKNLVASGLESVLYTTHSHGIEGKGLRYRLALVVDRFLTIEEFKVVSKALALNLVGKVYDPSDQLPYQQAGMFAAAPERAHLAECLRYRGALVSADKALRLAGVGATHSLPFASSSGTQFIRDEPGTSSNDAMLDETTRRLLYTDLPKTPFPIHREDCAATLKEILNHPRLLKGERLPLKKDWSGAHDLSPVSESGYKIVLTMVLKAVGEAPKEHRAAARKNGREIFLEYAYSAKDLGVWKQEWNPKQDFDNAAVGGMTAIGPWALINVAKALEIETGHITGRGRLLEGEHIPAGDPNLQWIQDFNQKYSPVLYGTKMAIAFKDFDEGMGRERWVFVSFPVFKDLHCAEYGVVAYDEKDVPMPAPKGAAWLKHPLRAPNRVFYFNPEQPPGIQRAGYLNLWMGLNVEGDASQGDPMPMVRHIRGVIADGDEALGDYVMGWVALLIQKPWLRHEVALVLRGKKGCGKGTLGNLLCKIFGKHGIAIRHSRHLVGNFNEHLLDCCFLFADEAFFAGDKAGEAALKGMITEPTATIEPKGIGAFSAPNRLSILMATNSEYVVPATADERRYAVLDVSDSRVRDRGYWNRLHGNWMGNPDNIAAFVGHMQEYDLSGYNPRAFPETRALAEQRAFSLEPWAEWWYESLAKGGFFKMGIWYPHIGSNALHDDFLRYCARHSVNTYGRLSEVQLGLKLKKHALCGPSTPKYIGVGEDVPSTCGMDGVHACFMPSGDTGKKFRCRQMGTLEEARARFVAEFGLPSDIFREGA